MTEKAEEYNQMFRAKPNRWSGLERSDFMIGVLKVHKPDAKFIIDVGCGNGIGLQNVGHHYSTSELYGIDISEEAIKLAQERVPDGKFTTEEDFTNRKKFDIVICAGVAEHVEQLPEFLQKLKSRLKKDGICYFEVPHNLVYSRGPKTFRRLTVGSKQVEWHYELKDWEKLLIEAGFEVVRRYRGRKATWGFIWVLR